MLWRISDLFRRRSRCRCRAAIPCRGGYLRTLSERLRGWWFHAGPALQGRFTAWSEAIDPAVGTLEPAIHVAAEDLPGVRRDRPQVARPPRPGPQQCRTGQRLLPIGGHDRLPGRATRRWITAAPRVLCQQARPAARVRTWPVGAGFGEHLDTAMRDMNGHQAESKHAAQPMHAAIPVPAAPGRRHGQPHLIRHAHAIHRLQQQIEAEPKLHLHDRQTHGFTVLDGDRIATPDLALHAEAGGFEEALDGGIEGRFGHATTLHHAAASLQTRIGWRDGDRRFRRPGFNKAPTVQRPPAWALLSSVRCPRLCAAIPRKSRPPPVRSACRDPAQKRRPAYRLH